MKSPTPATLQSIQSTRKWLLIWISMYNTGANLVDAYGLYDYSLYAKSAIKAYATLWKICLLHTTELNFIWSSRHLLGMNIERHLINNYYSNEIVHTSKVDTCYSCLCYALPMFAFSQFQVCDLWDEFLEGTLKTNWHATAWFTTLLCQLRTWSSYQIRKITARVSRSHACSYAMCRPLRWKTQFIWPYWNQF